jgi:hypothetical protein
LDRKIQLELAPQVEKESRVENKEATNNYNRENDLYKFSKRNVHFSPFFRGSSSCLEYQLKGF